ncbi:hypothetical protein PTTG_07159 [Puccinia triticina 1-1 BBBD Race 1]|uniref:Uncharacterized protein n=2 Tax=Puccinia triticina TaxID=208348 RepID=A0A180GET3_PUCT1|nr:uncharacterized protein PtA15_15A239 [Puccinia triticina]OAV91227.1 hypothetical protein PTTG_07159 [Puccinia triticina 1-1 BBBD Race 1]WAQ91847.1 hypothetical protein PtA15_15A239 [Puccinia triticina]WAR62642.1 hypothetical protein PtB15_15B229 [Puccinia triticina]
MNTDNFMRVTTDAAFKRLFGDADALIFLLRSILPDVRLHQVTTLKPVYSQPSTPSLSRSTSNKNTPKRPISSTVRNVGRQQIGECGDASCPGTAFSQSTGLPFVKTDCRQTRLSTWNFKLSPVYVIAICDFSFQRLRGVPTELQDAWLCPASTFFDGKQSLVYPDEAPRPGFLPFNDVAHYILISLPSFHVPADACKTPREQLVWLLRHLGSTNNTIPKWVQDSEDLKHLLETVRIAGLSREESVAYRKELEQLQVVANATTFAIEEAKEEGRQEGQQLMLDKLRGMADADEIMKYINSFSAKRSS